MERRSICVFRLLVWFPAIIALLLVFIPTSARATTVEQGDSIIFSYNESSIYQEVAVDTSGKSEITAVARVAEFGYGVDRVLVGISLYGNGGGGIYFHDTGWVSISPGAYSDVSLSVNAQSVGQGWASVASARITIAGDDGEFWGGNYGPSIESASLKIDNTELLDNSEFAYGEESWISSAGWQLCHATQGDKPCSSIASRVSNSNYSFQSNMVWGTANEGGTLSLAAPGGGEFTQVVFASYGTPSGVDGQYTQGGCHSQLSILKVSQSFFGKSSSSINANNGVFGDPCGGTYKRLYVVIRYSGGTPNTTTTTTAPPPPTCGPYGDVTVTGKLSGTVWGSGPYTDDSDFGVVAVHSGLAAVGETVTLSPVGISYYPSYSGSTSNGVTTLDWNSGWCGYNVALYSPTTTTTTTTTLVSVEESVPTTSPEIDSVQSTVPPPVLETPQTDGPQSVPAPEPENTPETTEIKQPEESIQDSPINSIPDINDNIPTNTESNEPTTDELLGTITQITDPEQLGDAVAKILDAPLSDEQFTAVIEEVFSEPLSAEELTNVLEAVFDEPISDEKFDEVLSAVLDQPLSGEQFAAVVDILENENITEEQVSSAVDAVLETGITEDQALELATSDKVLESIDTAQAEEIFDTIDASELTPEEATQIVEAVQEAPTEVRETFEDVVDLFSGTFDTYEMVNQTISVGERRTIVAVNLVTATVAATAMSGGMGGGGSPTGPTNSGGGAPSDANRAARKEEDEQEMAGEIAGDGVDWVSKLSIYKTVNGGRVLDWKAFIKKFWFGVLNLGFTIAGSVVVYFTLSGKIQTIALVSTLLAFTSAMYLHMREPD